MRSASFAAWTALVAFALPTTAFADDPTAVLERYRQWRGGAAFEQLVSLRASGAMTGSGLHGSIDSLIHVNQQRWRKTLAVEISYSLEGHNVHFDLLLLFTEDSIQRLSHKINYLLN